MTDTRQQTLIKIRNGLELILGETYGYNLLGKYEIIRNGVVIDTVPSIQIRYPLQTPNVTMRMKTGSGIECIIESEQDIINRPNKFGHRFDKYFQVILDQHNPLGDLTTAVEGIISSNYFDIPESPVIRPATKSQSGVTPPRALIFIRQVTWKENLVGG